MGTVLISWELGGGLGHLVQLAPLARGLAARGHVVFAALRHLERAEAVFGSGVVRPLAAPWATTPVERQVRPPLTFAHILHNMGWHDRDQLRGLCGAWRTLFELVRPDVVVFDHAPTALLASRGLEDGVRRVVVGSGFCLPPDVTPLLNLRPWAGGANAEPARLTAFERGLLQRMNEVTGDYGGAPLERVTQIYSEVDETLLVTLPELDHYQDRGAGPSAYWGPVHSMDSDGEGAKWPEANGGGKRVFAYLKDFPALPAVLEAVERGGHACVVVCDGVAGAVRERFGKSPSIRFEDKPLDSRKVGAECDAAVLNAGHGAAAAMLLAGKPALLVPIHLEQGLLARAVVRNTGAAIEASYKDGADAAGKLATLLASETHAAAARAFAGKYAGFDHGAQVERMVGRVEELLEVRRAPGRPVPGRDPRTVFAG